MPDILVDQVNVEIKNISSDPSIHKRIRLSKKQIKGNGFTILKPPKNSLSIEKIQEIVRYRVGRSGVNVILMEENKINSIFQANKKEVSRLSIQSD